MKKKPFSYSSDWADLENYDKWACHSSTIRLRKNQFPIKEIAEYVLSNLNHWEEDIEQNRHIGDDQNQRRGRLTDSR